VALGSYYSHPQGLGQFDPVDILHHPSVDCSWNHAEEDHCVTYDTQPLKSLNHENAFSSLNLCTMSMNKPSLDK
jgi:hypothetical protein